MKNDFPRPVARGSQRLLAHYTRRAFTAFFVFLLLTGQSFSVPSVHSASTELSRDEAFSYFLLNCAYFGKWHGNNDPQVSLVIRIGLLGADPFGKVLDSIAKKAQSAWFSYGRIEILRADSPNKLRHCHVVYISSSEKEYLDSILATFHDKPVLLVSEIQGFARYGGTVEVQIYREHLRFILNLDELKRINVEISARMKQRATSFIRDGKSEPNEYSRSNGS
jgi:hypothetical protein